MVSEEHARTLRPPPVRVNARSHAGRLSSGMAASAGRGWTRVSITYGLSVGEPWTSTKPASVKIASSWGAPSRARRSSERPDRRRNIPAAPRVATASDDVSSDSVRDEARPRRQSSPGRISRVKSASRASSRSI